MNKRMLWTVLAVLWGATVGAQQPLGQVPEALSPEVAVAPVEDLLDGGQTTDGPLPFRFTADYLLWWIKKGPVDTPLVTTGNPNDDHPGALGQPGTQVLFPQDRLGYGTFSGMRLGAVMMLTESVGVEAGCFFLEQKSVGFQANSDPTGSPVLAHPFFLPDGSPRALGVSNPSPPAFAGGTSITSHTRLSAWDVNTVLNGWQDGSMRLALLGGFRALDLNEDLQVRDQYTNLADFAVGFLGQPTPAGSQFTVTDRFQTTNHFYGGQLGARAEYRLGNVYLALQGKVALGETQQLVVINGASTVVGPVSGTAVGGDYAQPSNIGRHYRGVFSLVPEGLCTVGYNITDAIRLTVGYTFLYWSNVVRPGNQIDPVINRSQVPTSTFFGMGDSTQRPFFAFKDDGFWAQGINFGLQIGF